jgi:Fe-S cluster assembly protein SufD
MNHSAGPAPLIEQWTEDFNALPARVGPDWLGQLRDNAAREFTTSGMPNRKTEAWKYTPLRKLEQLAPRFQQAPCPDACFPEAICPDDIPSVDIFDGLLWEPLPAAMRGVTLLPLAAGISKFPEELKEILERTDVSGSGQTFTALNTAFLDQGLVISVGKNVKAGSLLLRWALSGSEAARMGNFRLVVLLASGAELDLVEQFQSAVPASGALNIVTQVRLAEGASLSHVRVQNESDDGVLFTATSVEQGSRSSYRYSGFDLGGGLVRHQLEALLAGEGAETSFDGAFVLDRRRHVDNHISVDHAAVGCRSSQYFRGVLGGSSRGVFNGRALIRAGADGSSVLQSNANLLLSDLAEMDTKPELEIYADEVEASHGATVGQLDDSAIFYMRTRGLNQDQARRMLTSAFCHAVTDRLADRELAMRISTLIDTAMPGL